MNNELITEIEWEDNLEKYFKQLGEKCYAYSLLHKKAETHFSYYRTFIDIPVIVFSTALGALSIGGQSLFGEKEDVASKIIGSGSILVGIMNTINTYFNFAKRAEGHRISSIQYGKLYRFLSIELGLKRENRMKPRDLLKFSKDNYERLAEMSPLLPTGILNEFKNQYKQYTTSKPSECNGLEEIKIYQEEVKNAEHLE